jgi:hypothetical protein
MRVRPQPRFFDKVLAIHIVEENILPAVSAACSRRLSELMMW